MLGNQNLCPCGSTKLYADCCKVSPNTDAIEKLKSIEKFGDKINYKIHKFCAKHIDQGVMDIAWQPFMAWSEFSFEQDAYDIPESGKMFSTYQLYHWQHIEPFHKSPKYRSHENIPAQYYLLCRPMDLDERDYIETLIKASYCYYQILEVAEGHHMLLKNLFTDEQVAVLESTASRPENVGDVIFTSIVEHQNTRFMVGTGCYLFAEYALNTLADFRHSVEQPWQDADVAEHQPEMLDLYWGLRDELFNPHDNFEDEFEIPTHKGPVGPFTLLESEPTDNHKDSANDSKSNVTQLHQTKDGQNQDQNRNNPQNVHCIVGQIEMQYLNKWLNKKHPDLNHLTPKQAASQGSFTSILEQLVAQLEYSNPFHRKWLMNQLGLG